MNRDTKKNPACHDTRGELANKTNKKTASIYAERLTPAATLIEIEPELARHFSTGELNSRAQQFAAQLLNAGRAEGRGVA